MKLALVVAMSRKRTIANRSGYFKFQTSENGRASLGSIGVGSLHFFGERFIRESCRNQSKFVG